MKEKSNIVCVCTGDAGRSQIAEVLFRHAHGNHFNVQSAGVDPWDEIHPVARSLMMDNGYSMEEISRISAIG